MRGVAALLLASGAALAASACGSGASSSPAAARLEREDLVLVSRTLLSARGQVAVEVAATRAAWPLVANGLSTSSRDSRVAIDAVREDAARLELPVLFEERTAASITGPGSALAALFRSYVGLSTRGWQLIAGAIAQIEHGSPVGARFARANVDLYIESVYDGHFTLAQIGKQLKAGYEELGGSRTFGASLTEAEVDQLESIYSEPGDRLHPHPGVRLGS
jgi:hypothetical protein